MSPACYYSSPVFETGRFLGAVVVKRDITKFSYWTNQANAFIADANGVIVLAPDKQLEFRALPNASVAKLSVEKRLLQYKRSAIEPLEITPWGNARFPSAVLIGEKKLPHGACLQELARGRHYHLRSPSVGRACAPRH